MVQKAFSEENGISDLGRFWDTPVPRRIPVPVFDGDRLPCDRLVLGQSRLLPPTWAYVLQAWQFM